MIRIDVLPDDVLVVIFDFYVDHNPYYAGKRRVEAWQSLVHVCRRWRHLVFGSPHHLNLRLFCTPKTRTRDTLAIWPALPLIVDGDIVLPDTDNIIAALEQNNRVFKVNLWGLEDRRSGEVLAAMQVPFPELRDLRFIAHNDASGASPLVIPNSLLGGSVPRLRYFDLTGISFPGLPKLLLSATHLVKLDLANIPQSGYISPEAIEFFLGEPDRHFSSVAQVCNSSLRPLSTVEDLYIDHQHSGRVSRIYAVEIAQWLQLLLPFTAVENLYLSKEFAPQIAVALQELVGITEVLPNLQNIFVEELQPSGPVQENIEQFVTARRHSDHTIAISDWDRAEIMT